MILAAVVLLWGVVGPSQGSRAEDDSEALLAEKPLAECQVSTTKMRSTPEILGANQFVNMYRTGNEDPLASYERGLGGQWYIPATVDRQDPWLRLLVLAPGGPLIVDVAVYLDGAPHTEAREHLIDGLLSHASVEALVREAVEVPVPDDIPELSLEPEAGKEDPAAEEIGETVSPADSTDANSEETETETAESDKPAEDSEKEAESQAEETKESEVPLVEVRRRQARTVAQRLVNYMAAAEVEADREEVRWLLAEWTGGPALLMLGPAASWQRAGVAPLWDALNIDHDDRLSAAEIAAADQRMRYADVNENRIIDLQELIDAGAGASPVLRPYPLLERLSPETDWRQLRRDLTEAYGRRGAMQQETVLSSASALLQQIASQVGQVSPKDLQALLEEPADAVLSVRIGGKDSGVALLSAGSDGTATPPVHARERMLCLEHGSKYLEFSASETKSDDPSVPAQTQLSVGAVEDGYPLFRLLDHNGDHRLSSREQRTLTSLLKQLDRDQDGEISAQERPVTVRIAFARGAQVHTQLAEPSSADYVQLEEADTELASETAPQWFTDMDRNRDGDVSKEEFLGNSTQFSSLDLDGDGLLSKAEAAQAGK